MEDLRVLFARFPVIYGMIGFGSGGKETGDRGHSILCLTGGGDAPWRWDFAGEVAAAVYFLHKQNWAATLVEERLEQQGGEASRAGVQLRGGLGTRSGGCRAGAAWHRGAARWQSARPLVVLCRVEARGGEQRVHARRRLCRKRAGVGALVARAKG
jgi:hypothetical protein